MQTKFSSATHQNSLIKQPDEETLGDLSKQCIMALINTAPFCNYSTKSAKFFKKHLKQYSGIKTHSCNVCKVSYDTEEEFAQHLNTHHPKMTSLNL